MAVSSGLAALPQRYPVFRKHWLEEWQYSLPRAAQGLPAPALGLRAVCAGHTHLAATHQQHWQEGKQGQGGKDEEEVLIASQRGFLPQASRTSL